MSAEKKGNAASEKARKARLAAELRTNLLKRKAQAKQRKAAERTAPNTDNKD